MVKKFRLKKTARKSVHRKKSQRKTQQNQTKVETKTEPEVKVLNQEGKKEEGAATAAAVKTVKSVERPKIKNKEATLSDMEKKRLDSFRALLEKFGASSVSREETIELFLEATKDLEKFGKKERMMMKEKIETSEKQLKDVTERKKNTTDFLQRRIKNLESELSICQGHKSGWKNKYKQLEMQLQASESFKNENGKLKNQMQQQKAINKSLSVDVAKLKKELANSKTKLEEQTHANSVMSEKLKKVTIDLLDSLQNVPEEQDAEAHWRAEKARMEREISEIKSEERRNGQKELLEAYLDIDTVSARKKKEALENFDSFWKNQKEVIKIHEQNIRLINKHLSFTSANLKKVPKYPAALSSEVLQGVAHLAVTQQESLNIAFEHECAFCFSSVEKSVDCLIKCSNCNKRTHFTCTNAIWEKEKKCFSCVHPKSTQILIPPTTSLSEAASSSSCSPASDY